jgi:hypothetical protein
VRWHYAVEHDNNITCQSLNLQFSLFMYHDCSLCRDISGLPTPSFGAFSASCRRSCSWHTPGLPAPWQTLQRCFALEQATCNFSRFVGHFLCQAYRHRSHYPICLS